MSGSPSLAGKKKHWWLTDRKLARKYVRDARALSDVSAALGLLDAALALSPRLEAALELKARSLLFLRRFREVGDMLRDYIPSYRAAGTDEDSTSSLSSDNSAAREAAGLLLRKKERSDVGRSFRCFSELKRKVLAGAGLSKNDDGEGQWRCLVLGQACYYLGMMDDALVLLQTGRRLAAAALRRESVCSSDDSFAFSTTTPLPEPEAAYHLLSHVKLLLRRRAAALASLDAGLPSEAARHFSKILDSRRATPHIFAAACFVGRAAAYRAAGRVADALADCDRALALNPTFIPALGARADLFEAVGCLPDCLRDLDHLKLLYNSILHDCKLPGPVWRPHFDVRYRDIPSSVRALTERIQNLRRMAVGEGRDIDYYALMGVPRGCTRSELERAHLLFSLRYGPDKAVGFVERVEFPDYDHHDANAARDQARMSARILCRLLQKGYSSIMATITDEEAAEKQRLRKAAEAAVTAAATATVLQVATAIAIPERPEVEKSSGKTDAGVKASGSSSNEAAAPMFKGVFCRDIAVVGSLLAHPGIPVKYEGLSF